jgi:predicted DNA-binding transcriptional regulator AlpA
MATGSNERLLTRKEAARYLGFREQTLARWKWAGRKDRPPEILLGRTVRYSPKALEEWLKEHSQSPFGGEEGDR